ncbi:UDP-glucosyl transferase 71B5 [Actinidia rufa]|uniref:UDP-glucosyl transferase 71B5 n=1 Tax=Actinidia rufa TaxID=165716 RepID=A0A7J0G9X1_9ERIC|nr:UDP-glucosyl transferase 71B5 [Actinidia rufa]
MKDAAELVFIPCPGMDRLLSTVEMAKQLIVRDQRLSITIVIMKFPFEYSTDDNQSQHHQRLRVVYLPQEESAVELLSKFPDTFLTDFMDIHKPHVRHLVSQMISTTTTTDSTRFAGFIIDMFCTPMMDVAAEFGLPTYAFFTGSAAHLGLIYHHFHHDVSGFKNHPDAELTVAAFANRLPAKVLPLAILDKEGIGSSMFIGIAERMKQTRGIMTDQNSHPFEEIMRWLDDQPTSSVLFLCFGNMGSFGEDQVAEIARALEQSGHRFLWSLRLPGHCEDREQILPKGFTERTAEMGKVIGWAPQVAVLGHAAVGGFVSHCGWTSLLESLWGGVPVVTWPMYAEQQMNAFEMVRELGLAVEIKIDYAKDFGVEEVLVTAEVIERGIRMLMDGGDEIREK